MTIKVGDRVPDGTLTEFIETETAGCSLGPNAFQVADLARGKTIALFAVPGASRPPARPSICRVTWNRPRP